MPDRIQSFKVVCGGGLDSTENHLDISENKPGCATRLVNYEVSLYGGYRRIEGFQPYDENYAEVAPNDCQGKILSVAIYKDRIAHEAVIIVARKLKPYYFTATAGQTTFTGVDDNGRTLEINNPASHIFVTQGGSLLYSSGYTVPNSSTLELNFGATAGQQIVIDPNEYGFFRHTPTGWDRYVLDHDIFRSTTDGAGTHVNKLRHVGFNFGDGNNLIFVDGINPALIFDGYHWDVLLSTGDGTSDQSGPHAPGGDQCLDAPALVDVFENHIILGGDVQASATVAYSAPNNPYNFTVAAGAGQLSIGFDVVQFKPFRDDLFVFGNNAIKKVAPDVTYGFVLDNVTANVGCIARDSVLEIGGDLVFLAPDGLRPVAGTSRIGDVELETISKDIQQLLTELPRDYDLDTLNGVVIRSKSQLRYFIGDDDTATTDSFGIIGGLRSADQRLGWEFGELIGIRASACASEYVNREELVLHGDYDGCIYRQEQGSNFNGQDILAIYSTPYYDFGDTEVRKTMRKVNTFIRSEGPLTMNMAMTFDWDDPTVVRPSSYSASSRGAPVRYKGRNINYGGQNINYGGNEKPIITTSVQGSGFSTQLTYVTLGDFNPYSIQGIVFEFSIAGRR